MQALQGFANPNPRSGLFLSLLPSYFTSLSNAHTSATSSPDLSIVSGYLIDTFSFSRERAVSVSNSLRRSSSVEKPKSAVQFLQQIGFSTAQIQSSVNVVPRILFLDVEKVLKPKLEFYQQQLALTAPDLGDLISKNPRLLLINLEKKLIPGFSILKKILTNDGNNRDLIRVLRKSYLITSISQSRLLSNVTFLENCKIGRLDMLLRRSPNIFFLSESALRERVSRALEMGFQVDSGLFVYALCTICDMTVETFSKKLLLLRSFGFSNDECMEMFRRCPTVVRGTEERLKSVIGFFLNQMDDIKFERSMLVRWPYLLNLSLEKRIIPRSRVLRVVLSKRLLKKEPSFSSLFCRSEEAFLKRYVMKFIDDAEELLMAYRGGHLVSSNN